MGEAGSEPLTNPEEFFHYQIFMSYFSRKATRLNRKYYQEGQSKEEIRWTKDSLKIH